MGHPERTEKTEVINGITREFPAMKDEFQGLKGPTMYPA